jgi:hypothetical protein
MVHYNISFDFTDPKNHKDVNHMNLEDLTKEESTAWMLGVMDDAINGRWLISHFTITKTLQS